MANILVTGGTGYIGSHTCVELLNEGHNVVVLDNYCNSTPKITQNIETITGRRVKLYQADIRDVNRIKNIFVENDIKLVMHFAGLKSVCESTKEPLLYFDNNINGTIVLLQVMQQLNVKKIIFSSSATVYGTSATVPYNENMPVGQVCNPYGRTKFFIEEILKDFYASDNSWDITILRYFNPIGAHASGLIGENPRGTPNNLMPYITQVAIGKLPQLIVFGNDYATPDGTCIRDYIHVVDLAKGHLLSMNKMLQFHCGLNIYNLGTGCGYSVLELINTFEKVSGQKINYKIGARRPGDLPIVYANTQKAKNELGFRANFSLKQMCKDAWRWQKNATL